MGHTHFKFVYVQVNVLQNFHFNKNENKISTYDRISTSETS